MSTRPLGSRQRFALELLRKRGRLDGLTLGRAICERRGRHPAGDRCEWCLSTGNRVLVSLVPRELIRVCSIEVELREQQSEGTVDDAEVARMRRKRDRGEEQ